MFSKNTQASADVCTCLTFGYAIVLPGLLFWAHITRVRCQKTSLKKGPKHLPGSENSRVTKQGSSGTDKNIADHMKQSLSKTTELTSYRAGLTHLRVALLTFPGMVQGFGERKTFA